MDTNLETPSAPGSAKLSPKAYTVDEFCAVHRISRAYFYNLLKEGRAPDTMKLGRRRLISAEAAEAWRNRMTDESRS